MYVLSINCKCLWMCFFCCQVAKKSRSLYNKPMVKSPLMALVIIGILVPKDPSLYQNSHVISWLWQRFIRNKIGPTQICWSKGKQALPINISNNINNPCKTPNHPSKRVCYVCFLILWQNNSMKGLFRLFPSRFVMSFKIFWTDETSLSTQTLKRPTNEVHEADWTPVKVCTSLAGWIPQFLLVI